jgi:DNA-binding winged helix-turn-helix (wHTH) protein/Tfp pilus assembly protein PilF
MVRQSFAFGPFALDADRLLLFEYGLPVQMGRRALALLRALLAGGGDVVTKTALMDAAWPEVFVEEGNLTVQIAALRKRLGGAGEDWIATFPRVGYRFAGPFTVEGAEAAAGQGTSRLHPALAVRHPINAQAHEWYVRGRSLLFRSPRGNALARSYLARAIACEPRFAAGYACLGLSYYGGAVYYGEDAETSRALGLAFARTAVALEPDDPTARWALGYVRQYEGEVEEAEAEWEVALRGAPDHPDILAKRADVLVQAGRPAAGIEAVERALRLNPCAPGCYFWDLGFAYYAAGRYDDAVRVLQREELSQLPAKRILAASLAQLGRMDDARAEARSFLEVNPGFEVSHWASAHTFKHKADLEHFVDGYKRAGLPP